MLLTIAKLVQALSAELCLAIEVSCPDRRMRSGPGLCNALIVQCAWSCLVTKAQASWQSRCCQKAGGAGSAGNDYCCFTPAHYLYVHGCRHMQRLRLPAPAVLVRRHLVGSLAAVSTCYDFQKAERSIILICFADNTGRFYEKKLCCHCTSLCHDSAMVTFS